MKKLFSAFTAVLLAFCFISCAPQELSDRSSKNEGSVSLSIRSPRTISPAEGISYKDVEVWNVTFRDTTTTYDDIEKTVSFIGGSGSQEIRLPVGTYDVIFEGSVTNPKKGSVVPFYGKDSVTVVGGTTVPISVFVAPKKSADGTGSFNFTVTTSGFGNNPPTTNIVDISTGRNNYFTVSLTPRGDEIPVATWTPTEISSSATTSETGDIYSFSVSSDTLELQSVPSGFYTLSIKYTWVVGEDSIGQLLTKTKEIYSPYHDFLVEIIDGLTTNGSADITVSLEDSKTYYATTDATKAKGNGAFASMPGYFDDVLAAIKDTTISTANIIMVDSLDSTTLTITYPEIDVSKVNATGKTYNIYTKNETQEYSPSYTITGAAVEGGNPTIYTEVGTVNLKDSSAAGKTVDVCNNTGLEQLSLSLKDSTSVAIDFRCSVILDKIDSFDYYSTHPFMTAKYPISSLELSSTLASYTTASKTISASEYEYYILPAVQANPIINGFAYDLVVTKDGLSVTDTLLYAGDTVTITATSKSEGGSFADGTTFVWFINGKRTDCTDQSYTIKFGEGDAVAENTIICLVGYNGEYATAGKELTAVEQTALLYTRNGIGYSNLALLNERSSVTNILNFDSTAYTYISDFCIDTKTNDAYIIFSDESNTYIEKATYYHALTDMHYAAEDFTFSGSESNLIRMGNDNKLYVKFNLISDSLVFGIVELDKTAKTVNIIPSLIMHEVTSADQIMSFCVDDAGIMYIAYKDSDNGIQLAKFSIKEGILTKENNILLATISDADNTATSAYFTGISSALTVTDMHYEDGYVYLLVRDASAISRELPKSEVRSLGGVCKIKANDLTFVDNANPLVGWAKTTLNITEENGKNVYNYKHLENETLKEYYFYGPQKIIAIKPKEIVIADDGAYIENSSIKPQNRVVVFNLEQNSITDVKTSPTDFFIGTSLDTYSPIE